MTEWIVPTISGVFLVFAGLLTFLGTRGKTQADRKTALDARIDARVSMQLQQAWARIDDLTKKQQEQADRASRRDAAFARIFRAIANQWPTEHGPDLNPDDIREIEDTIPPTWIRRPKGA